MTYYDFVFNIFGIEKTTHKNKYQTLMHVFLAGSKIIVSKFFQSTKFGPYKIYIDSINLFCYACSVWVRVLLHIAHMDMILFEVFLKSIDLIPQQILQRHYYR